jgi:hypothetical protein
MPAWGREGSRSSAGLLRARAEVHARREVWIQDSWIRPTPQPDPDDGVPIGGMTMVKTKYYVTGETVPSDGIYSTFCDNVLQSLTEDEIFPPCPRCLLAASWRPAGLLGAAEEKAATVKKKAARKA